MCIGAFVFVKYSVKLNKSNNSAVKIISSLRLSGRDVFYVIKCGPEVLAIIVGSSGANLIGKWSDEEWNKNQ